MATYVLSVKFKSSDSLYDYYFDDEDRVQYPVQEDDLAVVNSPVNGYNLVTIMKVREADSTDQLKHKSVLGVVSLYAERMRKKNAALALITKTKLDALLDRQTTESKYAALVASNPEAAALIETLRQLGGL